MKIASIRTEKLVPGKKTLIEVLDESVQSFPEKSVLAITSKIVSICEGSVVPVEGTDKDKLIISQADQYLPRSSNRYEIMLTITRGLLAPAGGIDESNGKGLYILWPKDPHTTANEVRAYLKKRFKVKYAGVIITDSKTTPLRWGTTGVALSHSGFLALKNYIGTPDIFNRNLKMTKSNILDALAVSSVLVMGEGNEQTPLAIIEDLPFVEFQDRNPTQKEIEDEKISIEDDLYAPLLTAVNWKKK